MGWIRRKSETIYGMQGKSLQFYLDKNRIHFIIRQTDYSERNSISSALADEFPELAARWK